MGQARLVHGRLPQRLRDLGPGSELVVQLFQQFRQPVFGEAGQRSEQFDVLVGYPECAETMLLRGNVFEIKTSQQP